MQKLYLASHMTKRREFLRIGGLAASSLLFKWQDVSAMSQAKPMLRQANGEINWKKIRKEFPLDKNRIFLNNGTMGPSPHSVMKAVWDSMNRVNTMASYGGWEVAVEPLAHYFGADPDEIALTHNVTDGINVIAQGLPLNEGDELIISNQEHVGNALPWLTRARRDKLNVKVLDLSLPDERVLAELKRMIGPKTRVIALPHIPCTNGRVIPANEIGKIAEENNLFFFLDGAHGAGMIDLDFKTLRCDYYASCTHKWMLGPKGTGFLFIRKKGLKDITPIFTGAYSDTGWDLIHGNPRIFGWSDKASRHTNGTQSRSLYEGVAAAVAFHDAIGKQGVAGRIRELNDHLYHQLKELKGIQLITPENARAGICSFTFDQKNYIEFHHFCQKKEIIVRSVPENEVNAIRVSTHIYNSTEEIDTFVKTLQQYLYAGKGN
ncbi:MAG: aminotransferase class V-fold PLP-dependent enzyme [Bacteroidetes bacterium]|nr:aminotransferase class V-fold PLP-dependent enzyme [Bacteroidota bacterium]